MQMALSRNVVTFGWLCTISISGLLRGACTIFIPEADAYSLRELSLSLAVALDITAPTW